MSDQKPAAQGERPLERRLLYVTDPFIPGSLAHAVLVAPLRGELAEHASALCQAAPTRQRWARYQGAVRLEDLCAICLSELAEELLRARRPEEALRTRLGPPPRYVQRPGVQLRRIPPVGELRPRGEYPPREKR